MEKFSKNLRQAIKDKHLKQKELGEMLNLTQQSISVYVNGLISPDIPTIRKMCEILEVTPNELFGIYDFDFDKSKNDNTFNINRMRDINIKK